MLVVFGWLLLAGLAQAGGTAPPVSPARAQTDRAERAVARVSIRTDREGPYRRGQWARVFVDADRPTYLTVIRVDTDGRVGVLFPRDPWGETYVRAGARINVTGPGGGRGFAVDDDPGMGYLIALASPEPFDYTQLTRGDHWDYRLIGDGRIEGDPYLALSELANRLAADHHYDYDISPYYVGRRYEYPRFVCYDCHAYAGYREWDPYHTACTRYRMEIYDDPSYYPYRYNRGRNVVADHPAHPEPRFVFRDADPARRYVSHLAGRPDGTGARRGAGAEVPARGRRAPPNEAERDRAAGRQLIERRPGRAGPDSGGVDRGVDQGAPGRHREGGVDAPRGLTPSRPPPQSTGEPELRRRRR